MASAPPGAAAAAGGSSMGWIGPAIGGAASLGGAALGGKAAKEAAKTQERSQAAALDFAKQESARKAAVDAQRYAAWNAGREALMRRYGIDVPMSSSAPAAPAVGAVARPAMAQPVAAERYAGAQGAPANISELIRRPPSDWSDWRQYGLGPRSA